jgi:hypothetical protein
MTQFQWHFIPPNSPHFGGLWEAGVKSLEYHWRRIAGKALLIFEEFSTLITQVEACLNSRPLVAPSNEPNDPSYLRPGHFLFGDLLTSLPEPDFTNTTMNSLSRWQQVQRFNHSMSQNQVTAKRQSQRHRLLAFHQRSGTWISMTVKMSWR